MISFNDFLFSKMLKFFLLTSILLTVACASDSEEQNANKGRQTDGFLQMKDSIQTAYRRIKVQEAIYENDLRANFFRAAFLQDQNPQILFQVAREQLNMGQTDDAIRNIKELLTKLPQLAQLNAQSKMFYEFLAICYLRKAEQQNCQNYHSAESCIVPLVGEGVHVEKEPARLAFEEYEKILKLFPDDEQSRWLYNIAAMALDIYPDGVEPKYLIKLEDRNQQEIWHNRALELGVDHYALSGGVIAEDFNQDGRLDLMVSSWGFKGSLKYYEQTEAGFKDRTTDSGLDQAVGGLNLKQGDYDGDGDMDFVILRGAWRPNLNWGIMPNSLIRNNGDGTFSDVTFESGIYSVRPTQSATWVDYNLDGHLDLVVANESAPKKDKNYPLEFFKNEGNGHFVEEAASIGTDYSGYFKGICSGDIDSDGRPDLFVSNLEGQNLLLHNQSTEEGTKFNEIALTAGVSSPYAAFPAWFMDFDQDGDEDLYVASFDQTAFQNQSAQFAKEMLGKEALNEPNALYRNNGDLTFSNVTDEYFTYSALSTMGCNFGDVDNDGYPDFFLGTGAPDYRAVVPNRFFYNENGKKFTDKSFQWGLGHIQKGHGIAFADFNNNGHQDIYAVMGGAFQGDIFSNAFFLNPLSSTNSYLKVRLNGIQSNKAGIGARVKVIAQTKDGERIVRWKSMQTGASFGSNPTELHIGLGKAEVIEKVEVLWPGANAQVISYPVKKVNQQILLSENGQVETYGSVPWNYADAFSPNSHHHHSGH